jgi:hypothetical protein
MSGIRKNSVFRIAEKHSCLCIFSSQSAAALEAESGYSMESSEVAQFKQYILDGLWSKAEASLTRLGLKNDAKLWVRHSDIWAWIACSNNDTGCQVSDIQTKVSRVARSREDNDGPACAS